MKYFIDAVATIAAITIAIIIVLSPLLYCYGVPFKRYDYDKGTYHNEWGYGYDKLSIWHMNQIIYTDTWAFTISNRDSLYKAHLKSAKKFQP